MCVRADGGAEAGPAPGHDDQELSQVAEAGLRLGLEKWHEVCPCCFSEAYPEGLEQAVESLRG